MIPADHITFNDDGTAWWMTPRGLFELDRPCDTCPFDHGDLPSPNCPTCHGTGRHTFDIEVEVTKSHVGSKHDRHDLCENCFGFKRLRVHVVPDMVLEIVEGLGDLPERSCVWMSSEGVFWLMHEGQSSIITLPPAAKPGMWAVQLKAVSQ